jgi:hypothetical protein
LACNQPGGKVLIRRTIIATTIATLTLLGTTACNLTSPVASMDYYAPSDGAQADLDALKARNLMYLVVDETHSALVGSFANSSADEITFAVKFTTKSGQSSYRQYTVAGYKVKSFGFENQPVLDADIDIPYTKSSKEEVTYADQVGGSSVSILVYTNNDQAEINVPVMTQTENVRTYDQLFQRIAKN